jgi:hypothetical protein
MFSRSEFQSIIDEIENCKLIDQDFLELRQELIIAAVNYSRIRVDWYLAVSEERARIESGRTAAHDRFIDACNILSRYMGQHNESNAWRVALSDDRKVIGDFACYIHAIYGLKAR